MFSRRQAVKFFIILVFDVSGSMEKPFNETANSTVRSDALFSALDKIIQNTNKQELIKICADLFGCIPSQTCDFIEFISSIEIDNSYQPTPVSQDIIDYCESNSTTNKQRLGKLGEKFGAKYLYNYLDATSEDQCKEIYEIAKSDKNLCLQLVKKLPEKVKSGVSTMFIKGGKGLFSFVPIVGNGVNLYYYRSVHEEVRQAFQLCLNSISQRISCANYNWNKPVRLKSVNGVVLKNLLTEFKEKVEIIGKYPMLNWIKQFIYGNTPTSFALNETFEAFKLDTKTRYRILFMVTDGQYNVGGDPEECLKKNLEKDELKNVIIVSCYFSSDHISNPRKLYYKCPANLNGYCKKLFRMSSALPVDSKGFHILSNKYNWELPNEGACHLFFQVNHPDIINEFAEVVSDLVNDEDYFTNALSSIYMDVIRDDLLIKQKPFDQDNDLLCYAYACSIAIQLSQCRVFCRNIDSFNSIFHQIENDASVKGEHGGGYVKRVLEKYCPKYKLHFNELENEESARLAIANGRVCVVTFKISNKARDKFVQFFESNPKGVIKKSDIYQTEESSRSQDDEKLLGHAVVLIDANIAALEFLDSYGEHWGNNGRFRVENADVFQQKAFYDVYWTSDDLTQTEKDNYERSIQATSDAIEINDPDPSKYSALYFRCTKCHELIRDDNLSTSSTDYICPFCHSYFNPRDSSLRRGLFDS